MPTNTDVLNQAVELAGTAGGEQSPWYDNFIQRWLNPGIAQRVEYGQEVALQQMQNDWQAQWNDEREKMRRMKEAGINPLTAAGQIAGTSTAATSGGSVPSGQASNLPADVANVGSAVEGLTSASETSSLLEARHKNIITDTFLKYKSAGYTEEQSKGLAIANAYLSTEKFLGILNMTAQMDKLKAEYASLMQGIEESKKSMEGIDAQIQLAKAQGNLAQQQALLAQKQQLKTEAETAEINWFNQKRQELGIDPKSPIENSIFMMGITGDSRYEPSLGIVRDVKYNSEIGGYNAQKDTAFDIAYETGRANYEFNWNSAPKTMFEFITKASVSLHEKFNSIIDGLRNRQKSDTSDKPADLDPNELKQSYLRYKDSLDSQYNMLNMMRSELADRIAAGQNMAETNDLRQQIKKTEAELRKLPQTYHDFVRYVKKQK